METKKILSNYWKGTNIIKNIFPLPNEPYTAKLSLLGVLKPFRGNWLKNSILGQKIDYLRKKQRTTQKVFFFLNKFKKG